MSKYVVENMYRVWDTQKGDDIIIKVTDNGEYDIGGVLVTAEILPGIVEVLQKYIDEYNRKELEHKCKQGLEKPIDDYLGAPF